MKDSIYDFVFRGLLVNQNLKKRGLSSSASNFATLDKETYERLSIPLLDQDLVWRARKMATVFIAISAFENSLREFVEKKLLEVKGENWWDNSVPERIRKNAESRKKEEEELKFHSSRGDLINYLEFGDLKSIILSNWELFEPHLNKQEWSSQILSTLEKSRNVIMHGGELDVYDVVRIGTYLRDWTTQVGA